MFESDVFLRHEVGRVITLPGKNDDNWWRRSLNNVIIEGKNVSTTLSQVWQSHQFPHCNWLGIAGSRKEKNDNRQTVTLYTCTPAFEPCKQR